MNLLEHLVGVFAEHGYAAVLVALLLCGVGIPLPEDITLVAGGIIAGMGYASPHLMLLLAFVGVLGGDAGMFLLGKHYGQQLLRWRPIALIVPPRRYADMQDKFA